jgi:tRNA dimethylallyltransferase
MKKLIIICGATATGKTALAIQIAQHYHTSIISFDSRQCYKELFIGVAKPSNEELLTVPHYFINSHSIVDNINAVVFEKYALVTLETLFEKNNIVVAVGGTGLYIDALCNGVDDIPAIPIELRINLQEKYEKYGLAWLQSQITTLDKNFTNANDLNNTHRMLRALEVIMHTGNSIKYYQRKEKVTRNFEVIKYGIEMERNELYQRINNRVLMMMQQGLLTEVIGLKEQQQLNALKTVGYSELFSYLHNEITLPKAIELIQQHTRNYAKRQITWFKKDTKIHWGNNEAIIKNVKM